MRLLGMITDESCLLRIMSLLSVRLPLLLQFARRTSAEGLEGDHEGD